MEEVIVNSKKKADTVSSIHSDQEEELLKNIKR